MSKSEEAHMAEHVESGQEASDKGKVVYVLGAGLSKPAGTQVKPKSSEK